MTTPVEVVQIGVLKALVDDLDTLGMSPLHLRVDAKHIGDTRPNVTMWLRFRTDFERYAEAHGWTSRIRERSSLPRGQREWHLEDHNTLRRLLVQCVSFTHHPDWEPRTPGGAA